MKLALHIASAVALAAALPFATLATMAVWPATALTTISWACRERARRI